MYIQLVHPHPAEFVKSKEYRLIIQHKPRNAYVLIWDDASLCELVVRMHGESARKLYWKTPGIIKSDWGRYAALFFFGGIYLDTDVIMHRPIMELIDYNCSAIWYASSPKLFPFAKNMATNFVLAGPRLHRFWWFLCQNVWERRNRVFANYAPYRSGAFVVTKAVKKFPQTKPIDPKKLGNLLCFNSANFGTVATHVGGNCRGASWNNLGITEVFGFECFLRQMTGLSRDSVQMPVLLIATAAAATVLKLT